jgi:hypothetical protein
MSQSRRFFLKNLFYGTLSTSVSAFKSPAPLQKDKDSLKKDQMIYRRLGRTNLYISEISLGGSPLPDWALLREAIDRGVNYIDTSESYQNGNSERQIGRLIKTVGREKVYVGTKFHIRGRWDRESIINKVNRSLQRLGTDCLDVLMIHGASSQDQLTDERVMAAFEKLKAEGKYRFRGLSCHSNHHEVVKRAVECGYYDMVQLGYNVFDIQETEEKARVYDDYLGASGIRRLIALAGAKDVGIIAMKTFKVGARRQNLEAYRTGSTSLFQAMLKWVLENKNVSSVVTEMLTHQQLEDDLAVVGQPLAREERHSLFRFVVENGKDYCHQCGLCEANCPSRVKTASILHCLIYLEGYRKENLAKRIYSRLRPGETASSCGGCGTCERVCPYGVSIRKKIKEAQIQLA